jgi:hypothetical protein
MKPVTHYKEKHDKRYTIISYKYKQMRPQNKVPYKNITCAQVTIHVTMVII